MICICIVVLRIFNFVLSQETKFQIINSTNKIIDEDVYQHIKNTGDQ
jgi:hypothetical protein